MDWRESMLSFCGPGVLSGVSLPQWLRLLRAQWRQIDLSRLPRVAVITLQSLKTSALSPVEHKRYDSLLSKIVIQPPLFVLGHWRSGTTHLHQLIAQDPRFAFPNSYQTSFPHTFLSSEAVDARLLSFFIPRRRPMDNVGLSLASPQEDEFALCGTCFRSPCMAWVFPRQREKFNQYLTFKDVDAKELAEWKEAFLEFLRKVQLRNDRPLILKSPPHTARIRLLLELFPEAKFVHIHRNPFRVFQSSRGGFLTMFRWHGLQRPDLNTLDDWILSQYREMYEAFFEQKSLIPAGRLHEIGFEQLERDPIGEVRTMYEALDLPDFTVIEPGLRRYVDSLAGYRKNTFTDLPMRIRGRIGEQWKRCFDEWNYPLSQVAMA
jgi:hypothetical protein